MADAQALLERQLAGCKQQLEVVQWEHEYIKDQLTTTEVGAGRAGRRVGGREAVRMLAASLATQPQGRQGPLECVVTPLMAAVAVAWRRCPWRVCTTGMWPADERAPHDAAASRAEREAGPCCWGNWFCRPSRAAGALVSASLRLPPL